MTDKTAIIPQKTFYIKVFKSHLDAKSEGWFHKPNKAIDKLVSLANDLPDDQMTQLQVTFSDASRYNMLIPVKVIKEYANVNKSHILTNHLTRFIHNKSGGEHQQALRQDNMTGT